MTEPIAVKPGPGQPAAARIYILDVARFLAALLVVFYHYTAFGVPYTGVTEPHVAVFARYGYLGVDLFFMISGFVVLMSSVGRTPAQFVQSRFVRIVPMFISACLITYTYLSLTRETDLLVSFKDFLLNLSLVSLTPAMYLIDMRHIDGSYWTLIYETIFYVLIWSMLVLGWVKHVRPLLLAWLTLAAMNTLFDLGALNKFFTLVLASEYAPLFVAGGFFYMVWRDRQARWTDAIVLVACWILAVINSVSSVGRLSLQNDLILSPWVVGLSISAIFIFFIALSLHVIPQERFRAWAWAGALTYPLYLLHQKVGYGLMRHIKVLLPPIPTLLTVLLIVLVGSWLAHLYLERPIAGLFRRWFRGNQPTGKTALHSRK
ncbi:acyltransferase family protein [Deinococcus arenicola]|uniref:Acyltransferase n=1 Tax=Deinococcus arenicola TaxID=2994950 RepID=A0ABU4DSD5_9DEIO|nr:acyltransferase [Deinococcus sp. ZS9-10]MDV6375346.1 acyltransferase [Deinococcus sp. ZS9-10]